jgi:gluconolactonase
VSGRNIAYKPHEGDTQVLLAGDPEKGILGFNDITTDTAGRIYAGSLAFRPVGADDDPLPGQLFCIDTDGSARVVGGDVMLTNGMAFSPDGKLLYHSESVRHVVRLYDVAEDGSLSPHRTFAEVRPGVPDGLAVAEDGSVWVAVAHGSRVDVFEPDGSKRQEIPVEIPMVTSLCFGGDELRDLYIVTGTEGMDRDDAGCVFCLPVDVPGLPVAPAKVKVG